MYCYHPAVKSRQFIHWLCSFWPESHGTSYSQQSFSDQYAPYILFCFCGIHIPLPFASPFFIDQRISQCKVLALLTLNLKNSYQYRIMYFPVIRAYCPCCVSPGVTLTSFVLYLQCLESFTLTRALRHVL
jgi:hypothetical protein